MAKKSPSIRARAKLNVAVLRSFRVIYGSVREHFRKVQESCGISGSQVWILHEVRQQAGIGVSGLAARLSIHQSTCSLLVNKLVRAKLIAKTRSTSDHRRVGLALSAKGRQVLRRAPGPPEGVLPEAVASLPAGTVRSLYKGLAAVIGELDIRDDQAAGTPLSDL
jgi:MarR family transcriptional regulator, organic hydroperoxide resistance regulator